MLLIWAIQRSDTNHMVPDRGHYDTLKWIVAQKTDLSKGTDTREHNRQQNEKELAHQHAGKFPSLSFSTKKTPSSLPVTGTSWRRSSWLLSFQLFFPLANLRIFFKLKYCQISVTANKFVGCSTVYFFF